MMLRLRDQVKVNSRSCAEMAGPLCARYASRRLRRSETRTKEPDSGAASRSAASSFSRGDPDLRARPFTNFQLSILRKPPLASSPT
jgi:hypothetical protein